MPSPLKFNDGATHFRLRLITSLLSHRPLLLSNIRADDLAAPGLHEHEASFLRLLDGLTNGTHIEINATGTQLRFRPGLLLGGTLEHHCPSSRSIGWFLEGILPLAPFGKEPLQLTLVGVTDGIQEDPSADYLAAAILPLYAKFGVGTNDDFPPPFLRVIQRGAAPLGQGQVQLYCPIVKELTSIDCRQVGKVKRVRGTVSTCRIPPSSAARVAHSAKGVMHRLLPDVWIHTEAHSSKRGCGPSPGLSVILTATTTHGCTISADWSQQYSTADGETDRDHRERELPEEIGKRCAAMLLQEIYLGGCVDTCAQWFALLMMCLTPEDVSRIRLGPLTDHTIVSLRLYKEAFGVEFMLRVDKGKHDGQESESSEEETDKKKRKMGGSETVLCSCLGIGYRNMARAST